MATEPATEATEAKKIEIYPSSSNSSGRQVTPFWKEKYERDAKKYWDVFYRRHKDKFFKDRHYLDKEWGHYFQAQDEEKLVVLEVGCGAGNTVFPLISTYPSLFVHACDFSPRAIDLVKAHKDFTSDQINAFVCDLTAENLEDKIPSSSVDIVTMVFVLSAVAPEKMPSVLQSIRKVLKPHGHVLLRDYALGDLAQERLTCKEQEISENFYVRGDGTRAYYFPEEHLRSLFTENGFDVKEVRICNKLVKNRSLELVMNRRWIQAVFSLNSHKDSGQTKKVYQERNNQGINKSNFKASTNDTEIDMSGSIADLFNTSPSIDEIMEINPKGCRFRIKGLSKEYQHTCRSTGLMLWESARLMCNILAENPSVIAGKRVLELGCGSSGICSMIAVPFAKVVVSTDGDAESLNLLHQNVASNLQPGLIEKLIIKRLIWGNKEHMKSVKDLGSFEVIIGTDVTYIPEAITPLFETARELIANPGDVETKPALILCHIQRRVDEGSIISAASQFGFRLGEKWLNGSHSRGSIISSWFASGGQWMNAFHGTPLSIMYFEVISP